MNKLRFLAVLVNLVVVSKCLSVAYQNEDPLVLECGESDVYTGRYSQATLVRSYNFKLGDYRNYENCQAKFRTENIPLLLTLRFIAFDLEGHPDCVFDFLCINGVRFCGNWEQGKNYSFLVPANNSFTLWFKSDASVTRTGFEVKVEVQRAYNPASHREVVSGVGSSENLLVFGQSNIDVYQDRCQVSRNNFATPPSGYSTPGYTTATYTPPITPNNYGTTYDPRYEYYNRGGTIYPPSTTYNYRTTTPSRSTYRSYETTSSYNPWYTFYTTLFTTSYPRPTYYTTQGTTYYPRYYNNGAPNRRQGRDTSIPGQSQAATVVQCYDSSNFVLTTPYSGNHFIIRSPNFGIGPYDDTSTCRVQFRTSYTPSVFTLHYNSFATEYSQTCGYDWLCVKGIRFCGSWLTGQEFQYAVPAQSSFTVNFRTDVSIVAGGFEIDVRIQNFLANRGFFEPSLGVGSSVENLNYTWTDIGNYVDKCNVLNTRV